MIIKVQKSNKDESIDTKTANPVQMQPVQYKEKSVETVTVIGY